METVLKQEWKQYTLGEIAEYFNGRAFKPTEWETKGLPIIRIQNLKNVETKFNYYSGEYEKKNEVNNGDVLFSWSGTIGTSLGAFKWERGKAILNQHIFRVEVNEKIITPNFFVYLMNFYLDKINHEAHGGVGLGHITKANLVKIKVAIPPLEIQKKIVAKLDAFSLEYEILKQEKVRAKNNHEKILQGAISKLIELNKVEFKSLGEICSINPSKRELDSLKDNTEVSFVPMKAVSQFEGAIVENDVRRYGDVNKGYTYFKERDVLFAKITPCMENGKIAIVGKLKNGVGFGSTEFHVLRCNEELLPEFLYFVLRQKSFRQQARMKMTGTAGQLRVPSSFLETYQFPVPSLPIQQKIIHILKGVKDVEIQIHKEQTKIEEQLEHLPISVLSKAFKGELVN